MEKTIEASRFVAQHVRNKDKYESVSIIKFKYHNHKDNSLGSQKQILHGFIESYWAVFKLENNFILSVCPKN